MKFSSFTRAIAVANGTVATGTNRNRVTIQNLAAEKLYYKKGTGASASSFDGILAPDTAADDGYGGSIKLVQCCTAISIFAASTTPRAVVSVDSN